MICVGKPLKKWGFLISRHLHRGPNSVALLKMVAPGWDLVVSPFFGPEIGEDQKKQKQSLHHKLVVLWFHIIIWCHSKMVSPGAGHPRPLSFATAVTDEVKVLILTISTFILVIFHSRVMALLHCHDT